MALLLPGRRVFVAYQGYDDLYHERLVLAHVNLTNYVVATPDYDVYTEQLDSANPDLVSFRLAAVPGVLPIGIDMAQTYRFAALSAADEAALIVEGAAVAFQERSALGLAVGGAVVALPVGAAAMPVPGAPAAVVPLLPIAAAAPVAAIPRGPPPHVVAPVGGTWVVDEPTGTHNVGDQFQLPVGAQVLGSRALVSIGTEVVVLKLLPAGVDLTAYVYQRRALLADDDRVLPLVEDPRSFSEAVKEMTSGPTTFAAGSALSGPPSATWWLDEVVKNGQGLLARHTRWRSESGVSQHSNLAYEHEIHSRALELGATVDGINLKNSVMAEFLLRRIQLMEEAVLDSPDNPNYEGARHFLGVQERRGGALIAPSLKAHVAAELSREAAIQKEKRKAREARPQPKPKGKKGGPKGGTAPEE
jgi:hypothetical protein